MRCGALTAVALLRKLAPPLYNAVLVFGKENMEKDLRKGTLDWQQYLVTAALVAAAFLIGTLYTEVRYLKKNNAVTTPVAAADPAKATPAPTPAIKASDVPAVTAADHILSGTDKAKATMVVYTDFECPFCKRFEPTVAQLIKDYGDKLRVVYRHYPLSFHPSAQKAAEAAECAYKQGGDNAFFKYVAAYFAKTDSSGSGVKEDGMVELASTVGLRREEFKQCLASGEMAQKVKDVQAGGDAASAKANTGGVTGLGTPSSFIVGANGRAELVAGAYPLEQLKTIIDKYMK